MAEQAQRETFTLEGKEYFMDSLDEAQSNLFSDINTVQKEVERYQLSINIAGIAKDALIKKFIEDKESYEEVPQVEDKVEA